MGRTAQSCLLRIMFCPCAVLSHYRHRLLFPELSNSAVNCLIEQKNSDYTKKATKDAVNVLSQYLEEGKVGEKGLVSLSISLDSSCEYESI